MAEISSSTVLKKKNKQKKTPVVFILGDSGRDDKRLCNLGEKWSVDDSHRGRNSKLVKELHRPEMEAQT